MPGSISTCVVDDTFPAEIYTAISESRTWTVLVTRYKDGSQQTAALVTDCRRGVEMSLRLSPAMLGTLRTFYEGRNGCMKPFNFTPPQGVAGVYRFACAWPQTAGMARTEIRLSLVEVA